MLYYLYSPYLCFWFSFVLYWQCLPHQLITNICRNYITNICSNSITNICCSSITNTYVVVELLIYIYIYCITNLGCSSITSICCIALLINVETHRSAAAIGFDRLFAKAQTGRGSGQPKPMHGRLST